MSWIGVVWPMMAAAGVTLALVNLFLWLGPRRERAYLWQAAVSSLVAALALVELATMRAETPAEYATMLRWGQVLVTLLVAAFVGYVHMRFRAGAPWLAWSVVMVRVSCLVPNFVTGVNLNFRSIEALERVSLLGSEPIAVPVGTVNPWLALAQLGNLLLLAFLFHAAVQVWRRGDREELRLALVICAGVGLFAAVAVLWAAGVHFRVVRAPLVLHAPFIIVVIMMAYDLSRRLTRAAQLAGELQSSHAQVRDSELRFRTVFEASPTALLMVDARGRIVLANAQAESVFGYAEHELIGMDVEMLVPHRIRELHVRDRTRFAEAPQARSMGQGRELYGLRKDGSQVPVVVGLRPISTPEGTCVLASVADISERLALEHETAMQREQLAHLSRVGMLGELSGSMAHELNQPLAAILSNAQAAQRFLAADPMNLDEVRASLADIVADDKRAGDVIRRLRAMLKKQAPDWRRLDLNELVVEVLRLAHSDLLTRNASASRKLAAGLPTVHGDHVQLQQVLINLLLNAGDAMQDCAPPRELTVRTGTTPEGQVCVSVCDTGRGIPPEDLERIFEPFVTSKRDGIGLGLAVCRSIIRTHGGHLWAKNNLERGATVSFTLPPWTASGD